jgi:DNA-binding transcriptional MerR regulator
MSVTEMPGTAPDAPLPDPDLDLPDDAAGDESSVPGGEVRARARKAPNAFRTISEVADELHIPQHVLRFWETKFPQVRPLKRGGGRRYYRPDDIALLRRISDLLYTQGYTIKGVQRLVREGGGRLSDDIPPAVPGERVEADMEQDERGPVEAAPQAPSRARSEPPPPDLPAPNPEAERMRDALATTLRELEALRALLA